MKWCKACLLPDTRPNLVILEDGVCNACHSHKTKASIDWNERESAFVDVVSNAKARSKGYDCIIPVSGGKDSTWQTIKCLEYGLKPLAVTWKTPGRTRIGQKNLDNLISIGVDHIDYQINPETEAKFMVRTLKKLGSTAIPMHLAIFNIPLMLAVKLDIPLIVWGENSAFEYGAAEEAHKGFRLDNDWLRSYGVTHATTAEDWIGGEITRKDLSAYIPPDKIELENADVHAVFLGYYFEWDPYKVVQVAANSGFLSDPNGPRVGFYDYADIDDEFMSLHHWMKWYKFGFTRTFDNLSLEIRNGRISRVQAIDILRELGCSAPMGDIKAFCEFSRISEEEFFSIAESFRNRDIWKRGQDGVWKIKDYLIDDWRWS